MVWYFTFSVRIWQGTYCTVSIWPEHIFDKCKAILYTLDMNRLEGLTKKQKELNKLKPLPDTLLQNLEEWLKVELTYSSNAIEGNTLSRLETAEVIERGVDAVISGKPLQDQLEAINHAKAVEFIKELATKRNSHQFITEDDVLAIHKIILTGIQDWTAGEYRTTEVFIRGSDVEFPLPRRIPYLVKAFFHWLEGQQYEHTVRVAADAHFKYVSIHPFIDGNGRVARLLMNLILLINGYPVAIIRNEERTAYLKTFDAARKENNMEPFYKMVEEAVDRSLDIYLNAAKGKQPVIKGFLPTVAPYISKKLLNTKYQALLQIGELAKQTGETIHTLRFWTKEGLLDVTKYSKGGYQLYHPSMIERVRKIRRMQAVERLTIREIKDKLIL